MSWGCFCCILYTHCIYGWEYMCLSNFKTTYGGVGTMGRVLEFRWVDRQPKSLILYFFSGVSAVHIFMVEVTWLHLLRYRKLLFSWTSPIKPQWYLRRRQPPRPHLSCSFIHHSPDTLDPFCSLRKRFHCPCLLIFWKAIKELG